MGGFFLLQVVLFVYLTFQFCLSIFVFSHIFFVYPFLCFHIYFLFIHFCVFTYIFCLSIFVFSHIFFVYPCLTLEALFAYSLRRWLDGRLVQPLGSPIDCPSEPSLGQLKLLPCSTVDG